MKFVLVAVLLISGSVAKADGFLCETQTGLRLKVFNHVAPDVGTRVPAVMIVSDPTVKVGHRTAGVFRNADAGLLRDEMGTYLAKVDLRDARAKGQAFIGSRLEDVEQIKLYVDFTYSRPVAHGEELTGVMTLIKRNQGLFVEQAVCTRYLKN